MYVRSSKLLYYVYCVSKCFVLLTTKVHEWMCHRYMHLIDSV